MSEFIQFFTAFDLPKNIAGDLSLLLLFIGISLLFGFVFGRGRLLSILISIYISLAFIGVLPESFFKSSVYAEAGIFMGFLALLTIIDNRLFDLHISSSGTDFFWRVFVMSLFVTGTLVSVLLSLLPKAIALGYISVPAYGYFASPYALIFWIVAPLLSLLFINNRLK